MRSFGPPRSIAPDRSTERQIGALQMLDHARPVSASSCAQLMRMQSIPAHDQFMDEGVVVGRIARHGHHDSHAPFAGAGPSRASVL